MARGKLKSLIDTFFCSVDIDKFYSQNQKEKLANWLRANGVIVPPCKVGDTVYCLETLGNKINDYEVINVGITARQGGWGIERGFDQFGKTLFLTREEAEKALAERKVEQ